MKRPKTLFERRVVEFGVGGVVVASAILMIIAIGHFGRPYLSWAKVNDSFQSYIASLDWLGESIRPLVDSFFLGLNAIVSSIAILFAAVVAGHMVWGICLFLCGIGKIALARFRKEVKA